MNIADYNYLPSQLITQLSFRRSSFSSLFFQQLSMGIHELFVELSEQMELIIFPPKSAFPGIKIFFSQTNKKLELFPLVPPHILFGTVLLLTISMSRLHQCVSLGGTLFLSCMQKMVTEL